MDIQINTYSDEILHLKKELEGTFKRMVNSNTDFNEIQALNT